MAKLTPKSRLKKGDMIINNKTGTIMLLVEKQIVPQYEHKKAAKGVVNEATIKRNVVFWKIHVSKTGDAKGITPGIHEVREKNIRSKIENGTLLLVKKKEQSERI